MLRRIFLIATLFIVKFSYGAFPVATPATASAIKENAAKEVHEVKTVANISAKEYEKLTGKKMNFIERLLFSIEKRRFINEWKKPQATKGVNVGGFVLGLFFGPFGVLFTYMFSHDTNFRKWAWVGFGVFVFILLLIVLLASAVGTWN